MKKTIYTLLSMLLSFHFVSAQSGLDPGFGTAGLVTTNFGFGETSEKGLAIALLPDGKLLVAGGGGSYSKLARYNTDGTLDAGFGTDGKVFIRVNGSIFSEQITDIVPLPGGTLLVAGYGRTIVGGGFSDYYFVARFLSNGSLDPAFTPPVNFTSIVQNTRIALQSDGKIIWVTGHDLGYTSITRLQADGTPDPGFASSIEGTATDATLVATDVAVLPNDDFLVGGFSYPAAHFALTKYSAGGTKQGNTVYTSFDVNATERANALAVQPDGKILLAGFSNTDFALARYNADGTLDDGFSGDGKQLTDLGETDNAQYIALQPDGKIIAAGSSNRLSDNYEIFAATRYLANGQLDFCFGQYGRLKIEFPGATQSVAKAMAIQADGKAVFAGYSNNDFALARYVPAIPTTWYYDADGDGYGDNANTLLSCTQPLPTVVKIDPSCIDLPPFIVCPTRNIYWVATGGDCNDNDASIHPGAIEICDGKDNDCDGQVDEGLPTKTWYHDTDGDGYGSNATATVSCSAPATSGWVLQGGDCNDQNAAVHPGAAEVCDGIDNNCNGVIDEGCSGKPTVSISDVTVYESAQQAVLTIRLSFITTQQVKLSYSTTDGTALSGKKDKDYKSVANTSLVIPPGTLSTTISIPVYEDGKPENSEYFYVGLSKPTNCFLGNATGTVTILDGTAPSSRAGVTAPAVADDSPLKILDATIYPNPSTSAFTLAFSDAGHLPVELSITNASGQLMKTMKVSGNTIRFGQEWKPGIYIVQLQQGTKRKTIKLVKY